LLQSPYGIKTKMTNEEILQRGSVEKASSSEMSERDRDLGFGEKVARESRLRFMNPDGSFNVARTGFSYLSSLNFYHVSLTMSWFRFLTTVLVLYFASNIFFGTLYTLCGADAIVDTSASPFGNIFLRSFFFSVQTFATIGYGTIHPIGLIPNLVVTIESYYSLLTNALITGLVFARFARPTARIIFSDSAIIAPYQDKTALMFRMVNGRNNQLIEVGARVIFAHFVEENSQIKRRFDLLELERRKVFFLPLAWTVVHPIDENSPIYNLTAADFEKKDAEILIMLSGTDETFAQMVHTRSSYKTDKIKFGYKFSNMYNQVENNQPISINIKKLSEIERVDL
jgi:inward rectifier potassium channel